MVENTYKYFYKLQDIYTKIRIIIFCHIILLIFMGLEEKSILIKVIFYGFKFSMKIINVIIGVIDGNIYLTNLMFVKKTL